MTKLSVVFGFLFLFVCISIVDFQFVVPMMFWNSCLHINKIVLSCWSFNFKCISNILHLSSSLFGEDPDAEEDWRREENGDDRAWDGWMASLTRWTWVCVSSGSWWWTGKPGVRWSMGSQRVGHDWASDWTELLIFAGFDIIFVCGWFPLISAHLPLLLSFSIHNFLVLPVLSHFIVSDSLQPHGL